MVDSANILGFAGVTLTIYSQIRVQLHRDYVKTLSYSAVNMLGGILLVISLCFNQNLPALIANIIWAVIGAYGVYRCLKYMRKSSGVTAKIETEVTHKIPS